MKTAFTEEQTFRKSWVFYLVLILLLIPLYGIYKQLILGQPFGDKPMSDVGLILTFMLTTSVIGFVWMVKLTTKINSTQIQMKFFPLTSKTIQWSDVKDAKVLNYGFVGGWGIRLWTKYGTVYNISGKKGLAIELNNGKKLLIGTQKEQELHSFMSSRKHKREY